MTDDASQWVEQYDESSQATYYYNASTGETSWEQPPGWGGGQEWGADPADPAADPGGPAAGAGSGQVLDGADPATEAAAAAAGYDEGGGDTPAGADGEHQEWNDNEQYNYDGGGGGGGEEAGQTEEAAAAPVWQMVEDEVSGQVYYYNTATQETSWERPEDYVEPEYTDASAAEPYGGAYGDEYGDGYGGEWDEEYGDWGEGEGGGGGGGGGGAGEDAGGSGGTAGGDGDETPGNINSEEAWAARKLEGVPTGRPIGDHQATSSSSSSSSSSTPPGGSGGGSIGSFFSNQATAGSSKSLWVEMEDTKLDKVFYLNTETGTAQWNYPAALQRKAVQKALTQERDILTNIYKRCGGGEWHDAMGWRDALAGSGGGGGGGGVGRGGGGCLPESMLGLFGVGVRAKHVTDLDLSKNKLVGDFPLAVCELRELRKLALNRNELTGQLPNALGRLTHLRIFKVSDNKLAGPIPESIVDCRRLTQILLQRNRFVGPIPQGLADLKELQVLDVGQNKLSGALPPHLGRMRCLEVLSVYQNRLTGLIPRLPRSKALRVLRLDRNDFRGPLPASLPRRTNLQRVYLDSNGLSGAAPAGLDALRDLKRLRLGQNPQLGGDLGAMLMGAADRRLLPQQVEAAQKEQRYRAEQAARREARRKKKEEEEDGAWKPRASLLAAGGKKKAPAAASPSASSSGGGGTGGTGGTGVLSSGARGARGADGARGASAASAASGGGKKKGQQPAARKRAGPPSVAPGSASLALRLKTLDVSRCAIGGNAPLALGSMAGTLQSLELHDNKVEGPRPPGLAKLPQWHAQQVVATLIALGQPGSPLAATLGRGSHTTDGKRGERGRGQGGGKTNEEKQPERQEDDQEERPELQRLRRTEAHRAVAAGRVGIGRRDMLRALRHSDSARALRSLSSGLSPLLRPKHFSQAFADLDAGNRGSVSAVDLERWVQQQTKAEREQEEREERARGKERLKQWTPSPGSGGDAKQQKTRRTSTLQFVKKF